MKKILILLAALAALPLCAAERSGFGLSVLVDDSPLSEYSHEGTVYIEARRGSDFTIRLTNPMPYRIAIALSVDGLNTIDAKHTDPWTASKWVLEPYETAEIPGWQVSGGTARRFYFTGEKNSYGAKLGQTANLGVIEAVVYRERPRYTYRYEPSMREGDARERAQAPSAAGVEAQAAPKTSDDYAATGMGRREEHRVERVSLDLDPSPMTSFRIRYEFRPQLVKLGVLPAEPSPLARRERARGFGNWCPQPD
jgi:hypothetical protein